MTSLIKSEKQREFLPGFSSLFDGFLNNDMFNRMAVGTSIPAVNIRENIKHFEIDLAAPGKKKSDFKVEVDDYNTLTISSESQNEKEEKKEGKVTRKEFNFSAFSRSFTLPENTDASKVTAAYEDGVLKVFVPKKDDNKHSTGKQIKIS